MKFPKPARPRQSEPRAELTPFLKAKHIGKAGKRASLVIVGKARLHNSQFGEQVLVPVKLGKVAYEFAIGTDKPNYPIMWDLMGDPNKWKGKISVAVVAGMNGDYIAIES